MIESMLRATGLRTGLYTSPHLHSVCERISVDGRPSPRATFVDAYDEVAPFVALVDARTRRPALTCVLEMITALAFACFADAPVDVMVVECGLGGTWDATNVVDARSPCDHARSAWTTRTTSGTRWPRSRGRRRASSRPGPVVLRRSRPLEAAEVIAARAAEQGAPVARDGPSTSG